MTKGGKGNGRQKAAAEPGLFSPRDMASVFAQLLDSGGNLRGSEELDRAQEKAFDAMEASTRRKRIALAREAIAISPLCSDGYLILAQEAATLEEALVLFRQAVEAGAKALGEESFEQDAGHFWGLIETRPYMRARHELALALWQTGETQEALAHYQELLRLNPNDNQGIRYLLADALLELGRDEDVARLVKQYEEDGSASWAWSTALLSFRRNGDCAASRKALAEAIENNPHVAPYLIGQKALPDLPDYYSPGEEDEAICYMFGARAAWNGTKDAKAWVEACLGSESKSGGQDPENGEDAEAERIADAVLALLLLGLHGGNRAWKGFDWDALDRLHRKGFISNPVGKAKSVAFTPKGLEAAEALYETLFVKGRDTDS